jgi:hypothetical protein
MLKAVRGRVDVAGGLVTLTKIELIRMRSTIKNPCPLRIRPDGSRRSR